MDAEERGVYRRLNASWKMSSLTIEERVIWEDLNRTRDERLAARVEGPLESANLRGPTEFVSSPPHLRTDTDPVSEMSCFLFSRIPDDGKSRKN
jgi:hypothetical protein